MYRYVSDANGSCLSHGYASDVKHAFDNTALVKEAMRCMSCHWACRHCVSKCWVCQLRKIAPNSTVREDVFDAVEPCDRFSLSFFAVEGCPS